MNRLRWIILLLGPFPIFGCALALGRWVERSPQIPIEPNRVFVATTLRTAQTAATDDDERLHAECEEKARRLESRLGDDCQVIVRSPYVIGGNLSAHQLQRWYERTIEPATVAMHETYFENRPDRAITVLLFDDRDTYNDYAELLFGDRGISIYGYYKPLLRTLIMNIGTGGGTLVHELTHALMEFDFADVPDWFNEGLASLHEQCRFEQQDETHTIIGLTNWRLSALQSAIREGELGDLESLIADENFRGTQVGLNYAQARYFCMYLQQQGKLAAFYRNFRDGHDDDPSGRRTVEELFRETGWAELDRSFRTWVLTLRFPAN